MPKRFFSFNLPKFTDLSRFAPPRQTSIYQWLTSGIVLIVLATVLFGGMPALILIWWQLERQVQMRVTAAQSSTQALYTAEQRNLLQLTQLVSERPSLCALMQNPNDPKLVEYLDVLRQNTLADALLVVAPNGAIITSGIIPIPASGFADYSQLPYVDFIPLKDQSSLGILAVSEIASGEDCLKGKSGQVIAFQLLDQEFMQSLAQDTGLQQSLIIGGQRVVTSFPDVTNLPLNPDATLQVLRTREACCTTGVSGNETYYVGIAPLLNRQDHVVALSEVALPANLIRSNTFKIIALFLGLSILVLLGGVLFTRLLTRRITDPIQELSEAAERMGGGDLDTPIPVLNVWTDIDRLASQLDRSRRNLKQIQQIARRELKHIVHILAATREGILSLDEAGMVTWANADACRLLGYGIRDLLRKHYKQIFPPAPGEIATLDSILTPAVGQPPPRRLTILNAQGNFLTLSVSHAWLGVDRQDGAQHGKEQVLILREVGEEQALNRLRAEFLGNVAHEFRTPLSAISASTELLQEEGTEMQPEELAQLARTIHLSVIHLQALVNNLLESATIEAGVFRLRMQPLHLDEVLQNVAGMMSPLLQRRRQHLDLTVQDVSPVCIQADADRLKQALVNLVENASKFSPPDTSIALSVTQETDALKFSVSDCGPGLSASQFESLFARFFTAKGSSGQYGIGLGLPIVKAIAEAHGGQAGAANRPEGGARVWFTIPLQQPPEEEE